MPPLFKKSNFLQPGSKRKIWFSSTVSSFILTATFYFWFLQPRDVISKQRILLVVSLWLLLSFVFFYIHSAQADGRKSTNNNVILGIVIAALLSIFSYFLAITKVSVPNNLFLLPRYQITIEIKSSTVSREIRLTGFFNGLSPVSYSSLKLQGEWENPYPSTLTFSGQGPASIQYSGWMVEKHFIEFEKNPQGGEAIIHWNESDSEYIQLYSVQAQKIKFDYPYDIPRAGRNSIVFLTLASIFILAYPIIQLMIDTLLGSRDLIKIETWFEETTRNLIFFTIASIVICLLATTFLFLTPILTRDRQTLPLAITNPLLKPNIFLVIVDALSAEDMSLFGYPLETTPKLKEITRDWSVYANAQSPSVCSIGVYPSLVSGHYPYILRPFAQYGNQIQSSDQWTDLFQLLKLAGYHTYWSGYLPPGFYHTGSGVDSTYGMPFGTQLMKAWFQMKAIRKQYYPYIPLTIQQPDQYPSIQYDDYRLSETINMLKADKFQSPAFLYLHFDGVHVMPGIEWIYPAGTFQGAFLQPGVPGIRDQYDEAILNMDLDFSKFLDELKQKDLYDQSMIILMADHGQVFRQGSLAQCSTEITLNETHVPLLIKYPGQKKGDWFSKIVSTIDITPTILEIAGLHYPTDMFDGRSLMDNISGDGFVFSGNTFLARYKNYIAVMDDQYKFVLRGTQYFLFNYKNDPNELNDLLPRLGMNNPIVLALMDKLNQQRKKIF